MMYYKKGAALFVALATVFDIFKCGGRRHLETNAATRYFSLGGRGGGGLLAFAQDDEEKCERGSWMCNFYPDSSGGGVVATTDSAPVTGSLVAAAAAAAPSLAKPVFEAAFLSRKKYKRQLAFNEEPRQPKQDYVVFKQQATEKGKKGERNESALSLKSANSSPFQLFAVFDGHGGPNCVEEATQYLQNLRDTFESKFVFEEASDSLPFSSLNEQQRKTLITNAINSLPEPRHTGDNPPEGLGSTIVSVVVVKEKGDSGSSISSSSNKISLNNNNSLYEQRNEENAIKAGGGKISLYAASLGDSFAGLYTFRRQQSDELEYADGVELSIDDGVLNREARIRFLKRLSRAGYVAYKNDQANTSTEGIVVIGATNPKKTSTIKTQLPLTDENIKAFADHIRHYSFQRTREATAERAASTQSTHMGPQTSNSLAAMTAAAAPASLVPPRSAATALDSAAVSPKSSLFCWRWRSVARSRKYNKTLLPADCVSNNEQTSFQQNSHWPTYTFRTKRSQMYLYAHQLGLQFFSTLGNLENGDGIQRKLPPNGDGAVRSFELVEDKDYLSVLILSSDGLWANARKPVGGANTKEDAIEPFLYFKKLLGQLLTTGKDGEKNAADTTTTTNNNNNVCAKKLRDDIQQMTLESSIQDDASLIVAIYNNFKYQKPQQEEEEEQQQVSDAISPSDGVPQQAPGDEIPDEVPAQ